jgi:hypothetical protein
MYNSDVIHILKPYMGRTPRLSSYTFCEKMIGTILCFIDSSYFLFSPPSITLNSRSSYLIRFVPCNLSKKNRKVLRRYYGFFEDYVDGKNIILCNKCITADDFVLNTLSHI